MQFVTITQYFHKLFSASLLILLVPIMAFIVIYLQVPPALTEKPSLDLIAVLWTTVLFTVLAMLFFFNKKIKSIPHDQGLRVKLEKYFYLTIVSYILIALGCMVLAYGFYITKDDLFTGGFVLYLVVAGALWPTSAKASNDLKLKGDEREMVYYKKDTF